MRKIVLLSGGLDSATCLAIEKEKGSEVVCLNVLYGQRHIKEEESAKKIAAYYGCDYHEIDLSKVFKGSKSSLIDEEAKVTKKSYGQQGHGILDTYVPFRNGLFLSAAAAFAIIHEAEVVVYGAHADDVVGDAYPDCSLAFVESLSQAVKIGTAGMVTIEAPLVSMNKTEVVAKGLEIGVPYELTWSCYEGGEEPCGSCATCRDRARAFTENGVIDPALGGKNV